MGHRFLIISAIAAFLAVGCNSTPDSGSTTAGTTGTQAATTGGAKPAAGGKKSIAFVTNNASDFWTIAQKGCEKAQGELPDFDVQFKINSDGSAAGQKQVLDDLVASGVAGIAVSPKDPANMTDQLNAIAAKIPLICQDSDAVNSKRLCYVGTDSVAAGRMAGDEVKKALPGGGKIMVFVGSKDAQNAKDRYQGLEESLKGSNVTILDERTDDADHARAKQNVADALTSTPDLAGCVGLWSYNGPAIYNAVKEANKVGKVKIVCFDEEDDTLTGIKDGAISATIVQQPFEFGYQSMKLLAKIIGGDKSAVPADGKIIIPVKAINGTNVDDFKTNLMKLRGK